MPHVRCEARPWNARFLPPERLGDAVHAADHLQEEDAQRPDVGPRCVEVPDLRRHDLGRHEWHRAHQRVLGLHRASRAKVHHFDGQAVRAHDDVLGLQVAVYHPTRMAVRHAARDLGEEPLGLRRMEALVVRCRLELQEVLRATVLHDEHDVPGRVDGIQQLRHRGVHRKGDLHEREKLRGRLSKGPASRLPCLGDSLQRHAVPRAGLLRKVDGAERTLAKSSSDGAMRAGRPTNHGLRDVVAQGREAPEELVRLVPGSLGAWAPGVRHTPLQLLFLQLASHRLGHLNLWLARTLHGHHGSTERWRRTFGRILRCHPPVSRQELARCPH
mmetsp:Transcript_3554/g.9674  ORF Transcript_3554/g.9674 Transcript_3554/m.9674 type:complete len:329 (+) Transcript_3554:342-1328(+)